MIALRAFATALAWWATLTVVRGSTGTPADVGLACVVAGALGGGVLRGALLSTALVVVDAAARPSRWAAAAGLLHQHGGLGIGDVLEASAPFLVAVAIGILAGGVARRASASTRGTIEPVRRLERACGGGEFLDGRPDLALRARLLRKDWAGAARLAETLGMPRSAARWWRAAGDPERARRATDGAAAVNLELADPSGRHESHVEPTPKLDLENPRSARFTIDPPDGDS